MPTELFQPSNAYAKLKDSLSQLYLSDPRPWLVGFSGGKDSTLVAALVFEAALAIPPALRTKEIHVVCTDTRIEIPAVVGAIETNLARMRKCAAEHDLKLDVHLLRLPAEQSFWVNIFGRGHPSPKRIRSTPAPSVRASITFVQLQSPNEDSGLATAFGDKPWIHTDCFSSMPA